MSIRIEDLKPAKAPPGDDDKPVEVIIKVHAPRYVPPGVTVRAWIDDVLYTANVPRGKIAELEVDPKVCSVAANKKLRIIE
jgi:hypothetical protein